MLKFEEKIDNIIGEMKTLYPTLKTLHPNFENVLLELKYVLDVI